MAMLSFNKKRPSRPKDCAASRYKDEIRAKTDGAAYIQAKTPPSGMNPASAADRKQMIFRCCQ